MSLSSSTRRLAVTLVWWELSQITIPPSCWSVPDCAMWSASSGATRSTWVWSILRQLWKILLLTSFSKHMRPYWKFQGNLNSFLNFLLCFFQLTMLIFYPLMQYFYVSAPGGFCFSLFLLGRFIGIWKRRNAYISILFSKIITHLLRLLGVGHGN